MSFYIKKILAFLLNICGITDWMLKRGNKQYKNQYIRIINYHEVNEQSCDNLRKQIMWLKKHYININYEQFKEFLAGKFLLASKPGIMLTFDDGFEGNYKYAKPILDELGMTGYYFVSSDLIGQKGYMTEEQIKKIVEAGHIIGSHTATHHRMSSKDNQTVLNYEIMQSKCKLEKMLTIPIEIFCWCGGEEWTYTKPAQKMIEKAGYKFGFMTNSFPVFRGTNQFCIQRINVESKWPISLMKFQISGLQDKRFKQKRMRVENLLFGKEESE